MINRQEDLSKVFDRTWQANHSDTVKKSREQEKKFINRMFNKDNLENRPLTPNQKVETLHNNMNNAFNGQRKMNINNIVKKWK